MNPPIQFWRMVILMTLFLPLGCRLAGMIVTRLLLGFPCTAMQEICIGFGALLTLSCIAAMGILIAKQP